MKQRLLGGVGAIAVLLGSAVAAQAFDDVDWEWNKSIDETITKEITISADFVPSGLVELESLQIHVGNLDATSTVSNFENKPPKGDVQEHTLQFTGETTPTDAPVDEIEGYIDIEYTPNNQPDPSQLADPSIDPQDADTGYVGIAGSPSGSSKTEGYIDYGDPSSGADTVDGSLGSEDPLTGTAHIPALTVSGTATVMLPASSLDATTELPTVESNATSVANNLSVESDTMVEEHDGQFAFGGFNADSGITYDDYVTMLDKYDSDSAEVIDGGNTHTALALALLTAGQGGAITAAEITATSSVYDIKNARVDSSATALTNNISKTLEPATADDAILITDATQFGYSNNSASSYVDDVRVRGYTNLGEIDPIISSTATAIGNNISFTVKSPLDSGSGGDTGGGDTGGGNGDTN